MSQSAAARPQEDHEQYRGQQTANNEQADAYQEQQQQLQPQHQQLAVEQAPPEHQQQEQFGREQQQVSNTQQPSDNNGAEHQQQAADGGYMATKSFVGGAQINQPSPSNGNYEQQQQQQHYDNRPRTTSKYSYVRLDSDRQSTHLAQQQAMRQAQLAELRNSPASTGYTQTTTPMSITNPADSDRSDIVQQQQQEQQQQEQEQEEKSPTATTIGNNNGYMVEQVQSRPSVQSPPDSMLINDDLPPMQMPISDQQSLIPTDFGHHHQESNGGQFSNDDDRARQQQTDSKQQPPTAVYQVYQAYYAPKDHKPLPGYVRLSLDEFNELFSDAEIQYVDKNMNGLQNSMIASGNSQQTGPNNQEAYEQQQQQQAGMSNEMMKGAASEQSIVVDRRSIGTGARVTNSSDVRLANDNDGSTDFKSNKKHKQGEQGVKKIISIRNSRLVAKQLQQAKSIAKMTIAPTLPTTKKAVDGGLNVVPPPTTTIPIIFKSSETEIRQKKKAEAVVSKQKSIVPMNNAKQTKSFDNPRPEASSLVSAHNLSDRKADSNKASRQQH